VTGTIDVGAAPQAVDVSPDGSLAFVTCTTAYTPSPHRRARVRKVPERLHQPHGVTFTPDGSHAWVTDSERDRVVVLKVSNLRAVGQIRVGRMPWNTAFSADGSTAYVTNANPRHRVGDRHRVKEGHEHDPAWLGHHDRHRRHDQGDDVHPAQPSADRDRAQPRR
jgi:YVTN family beta-propeller protein